LGANLNPRIGTKAVDPVSGTACTARIYTRSDGPPLFEAPINTAWPRS